MTTATDALKGVLAAGGIATEKTAAVAISGDDPILPTGFRIGAAMAASIAAVGVAANDIWQQRGGANQRIELDMLAVTAALRSEHYYTCNGEPAPGVWHDVSGFYPTLDNRWVQLHCNHPNLREGMVALLDTDENPKAVAAAVAGWNALDLEAAVIEANLCAAAIRTPQEWHAHPHAKVVAELPLLEVVKFGDSDPEPLTAADRPLAGVRALDLTHVIAGPVCGRTLAEHGAQILRLSAQHRYNYESFAIDTGLGKLSAWLDFREESEHQRLLSLVSESDVVVQGFRPGALAKFDLTPERLMAKRPGIVYVTLSAFGHRGPWSMRRGFDSLLQSTTGIAHEGGDGSTPKHLPAQALDYVAGYLAAFGAIVALSRRTIEGGSYLVRVSLAQAGRWIQSLGRSDPIAARSVGVSTREDLAHLMTDSETPFGRVRHVAPALRMSETPPHWERPAAPYGTHPAAWPKLTDSVPNNL